jgi:TRAP-type C4-dicarboxylate transport system permease small subunit
MEGKNFLKKSGSFVLNIAELYVPAAAFTSLFVVFMVQVFSRYFLVPLTWPLEFTLMAFIWLTLFGACFAYRESSHVIFTLIYDRVKPKIQTVMRIMGNSLLFIAFSMSLYPSYKYVAFMSFKKSDVLKVPMNLVFSPYVVFLLIMMGRLGYDVFVDLRKLFKGDT